MARLKFLVFALIALGLWGYHLTMIAPLALSSSVEQAQAAVSGAAGPVAVALESQRSLTQAVALKVANSGPALWNPGPKPGAKPEAPTVDRFAAARSAAVEALPAELKEQLFVAVSNEVGVLVVKGSGEPATTAPEGLDLPGVVQAGSAGAMRSVDGASYLLLPVPMAISDKNEVRAAGAVVVGLPVLPDVKVLEQVVKALNLKTVGLIADGKPVLQAGDKGTLDAVLAKVKAGATTPIETGAVREFGPLALPIMTDSLVSAVGARQAIGGTPFEVASAASSRAALEALAGYQVFALGGLAGLLLLSLVFVIIMGGNQEEGASMVLPPPMPVPPKREDTGLKPAFQPPPEPAHTPAPEASPDDFDFPASNPSLNSSPPPPPPAQSSPSAFAISGPSMVTGAAPAYEPEPTSDPFAAAAPPPPPAPTSRPPPPVATSEQRAYQPPANTGLMDEDEGQRTAAYPSFKPPPGVAAAASQPPSADPFALAAAQQGYEPQEPMGEDNPDATRVAAVPAELIKAARSGGASGTTGERPSIKPPGVAMPKVASVPPAAGANDEDRHFQEVFRDFVATREKCREPADGLTYDKFKAKLLKNKEQLVAKYQCRTVRFQVYVKDGKAALKATPVKD
jgi:hypothetical protein